MDKKNAKNLMMKITDILNEWDFLGVVDAGPKDEYDCLVGPLTRLVSEGKDRESLKAYIEKELDGHFGLDGHYSKDNLNTTLDKLVKLQS